MHDESPGTQRGLDALLKVALLVVGLVVGGIVLCYVLAAAFFILFIGES